MSIQSVNPFSKFITKHNPASYLTPKEQQNNSANGNIQIQQGIKYLNVDMTCKINNSKASEDANNISAKAKLVLQEMLGKYDELTQLYKNRSTKTADGKTTIQITSKQSVDIMKGYSEDNKELFSAMFIDGKLTSYKEGIETSENSEKCAKKVYFSDDKMLLYKENCEELQNGTATFKTAMDFSQNEPLVYKENGVKQQDGNLKCGKYALFTNGKPAIIKYNYELKGNSAQKSYRLINNSWVESSK